MGKIGTKLASMRPNPKGFPRGAIGLEKGKEASLSAEGMDAIERILRFFLPTAAFGGTCRFGRKDSLLSFVDVP